MNLRTLLLLGFVSFVSSICSRECQILNVKHQNNHPQFAGDYSFIGNTYYGSRTWKNTAKNKVIFLKNDETDMWAITDYSPNNRNYYNVGLGYNFLLFCEGK